MHPPVNKSLTDNSLFMVKKWIAKAAVKMAGVTVVHSIPGRLRIRIAGWSKVTDFLKTKQDIPDRVYLYKLKGIETFDLNPLTSKALITYDSSSLSDKDILSWLNRLQELVVEYMMQGGYQVGQEMIDRIAAKLTEEGYVLEKFEQRILA